MHIYQSSEIVKSKFGVKHLIANIEQGLNEPIYIHLDKILLENENFIYFYNYILQNQKNKIVKNIDLQDYISKIIKEKQYNKTFIEEVLIKTILPNKPGDFFVSQANNVIKIVIDIYFGNVNLKRNVNYNDFLQMFDVDCLKMFLFTNDNVSNLKSYPCMNKYRSYWFNNSDIHNRVKDYFTGYNSQNLNKNNDQMKEQHGYTLNYVNFLKMFNVITTKNNQISLGKSNIIIINKKEYEQYSLQKMLLIIENIEKFENN